MNQVELLIKRHWGSALAVIIHWLKDIELAEDVLQEAVLSALENWPLKVPEYPRAWLIRVARNKALDRLRREENYSKKIQQFQELTALTGESVDQHTNESASDDVLEEIPDQRLRLMFTCAHPALNNHAQVALTLHTIAGLSTKAIADAFLLSPSTLAQRLVRAKRKIKKAGISYEVPSGQQLIERLESVLMVIYLIFNEGYQCSNSDQLLSNQLLDEALYLGELMSRLMPNQAEVLGLYALMLAQDARRVTRISERGELMPLLEQDRTKWNGIKIKKAQLMFHKACQLNDMGGYQIHAAIQLVHCESKTAAATDWAQIVGLYEKLYEYQPSPLVLLNRLSAAQHIEPAEHIYTQLCQFDNTALQSYAPFYCLKAELLYTLKRYTSALKALDDAIKHSSNQVNIDYLESKKRKWQDKFCH